MDEATMRALLAEVPGVARAAVKVPTIRFGTVSATSITAYVTVLVDGDDAPVSMLNATGQLLPAEQRVVVGFYPPHGALVSGVLAPLVATEQLFTSTISVPSHATDSESSTSWAESTDGLGWTIAAGELVCQVPGLYHVAIDALWGTNGSGTHRAARVTDGSVTAATTSHQVGAPGGTPTTGYGLGGAGFGAETYAEGDTIEAQARQDSGSTLSVAITVGLRLLSAG